MGTDTTAALAALIVAIMAMIIATFQVLQQYLVTGQLIRMCDGVVYGKMPGRGRRVWEFSQCRFRVVYEIPRIVLRGTLWGDEMRELGGSFLSVPDLRLEDGGKERVLKKALEGRGSMRRRRGAYSPVPGEAPWVSFCRVVQFASGNDIFYELVQGDADRCPSDLSVVPILVSMRDIITMALMAGMRCTDASFEKKSLSMEGPAGTITSSWHPILGAIIHFTPKGSDGPQGLRVGNGSVSPLWMARMCDVMIVAGREYSFRERRFYEVYEGYDWVTYSKYRSLAKVVPRPASSKDSSFSTDVRKRRTSTGIDSVRSSISSVTSGIQRPSLDLDSIKEDDVELDSIRPSNEDGDWSFVSNDNCSTDSFEHETVPGPKREGTPMKTDRPLYQRLGSNLRQLLQPRTPLLVAFQSNAIEVDVEDCRAGKGEKPTMSGSNECDAPRRQIRLPVIAAGMTGRKLLHGTVLQDYINEKKSVLATPPQNGPLYLTWPTSQEDIIGDQTSSDQGATKGSRWSEAYMEKRRQRALLYRDQWRTILRSRSRLREGLNLDDEWELLSRFSQFAHSNAGDTTRPTTSSTMAGRSLSRRSYMSKRTGYSGDASHNLEQRGRTRRRSLDYPLRQGRNSLSPKILSSSRRRSRRRTSTQALLLDMPPITYGSTPIPTMELAVEGQDKAHNSAHEVDEACKTNHLSIIPHRTEMYHKRGMSPSKPLFRRNDFTELLKMHEELGSFYKRVMPSSKTSNPTSLQIENRHSLEVGSPVTQDFLLRNSDDEQALARVGQTKSILKPPREKFPEDKNAITETVAYSNTQNKIPAEARWTKISRKLVDPEALEANGERYEVRRDFVVVMRVLTRDEVQALANMTLEIRALREWERIGQEAESHNNGERDPSQSSHTSGRHRRPRSTSSQVSMSSLNKSSHPAGDWPKRSHQDSTDEITFTTSPKRTSSSDDENFDAVRPRQGRGPTSSHNSNDRRWGARRDTDDRSYYDQSRASSIPDNRFELVRSKGPLRFDDKPGERYPSRNHNESAKNIPHDLFEASGQVNWSWICQADVIPGFVATPWKEHFSSSVCLGAISTMLEILQYFTTPTSLRFISKQPYHEAWIQQGYSTHPSYAINAMGGIIVSGRYHRARFSCLRSTIPPILLLRSHEYQVTRPRGSIDSASTILSHLAELAYLDSWLAFCGRQAEICSGRNDLLRRMPAFIQKIMTAYDYEFGTLDRTASEGGLQVIRELAEVVLEGWERDGLEEPEMLFTAVAILRAAKMADSVCKGLGTGHLGTVLREDVMIHMV